MVMVVEKKEMMDLMAFEQEKEEHNLLAVLLEPVEVLEQMVRHYKAVEGTTSEGGGAAGGGGGYYGGGGGSHDWIRNWWRWIRIQTCYSYH